MSPGSAVAANVIAVATFGLGAHYNEDLLEVIADAGHAIADVTASLGQAQSYMASWTAGRRTQRR